VSPEFQPPFSPDHEPYNFTENERLFDRISHNRLIEIVNDPQTAVLKAEMNSNSFGEFLFVATKQGVGERIAHITFYGLGYHEHRERWIDKEWSWYESTPSSETDQAELTKEEAIAIITERQVEIAPDLGRQTQSSRGQFYEMLADLTDEDGALTELEDLGDLFDGLDDDAFPF
jgi:hypothetical protein